MSQANTIVNNIYVLYYLKKVDGNTLVVDQHTIPRNFDKAADKLVEIIWQKETVITKVKDTTETKITTTSVTKALQLYKKSELKKQTYKSSYDFCSSMSDPYSKLEAISHYNFENREQLTLYIWNLLNAFYLDRDTKRLNKNKKIKAVSHMRSGWTQIEFKLNDNFSLITNTNFGFGSVSYFFSIIKYKGIILAPFSEIIEYPFAKFNDVIRYTKKHALTYASWQESFQFIAENFNIAAKNETAFLDRYFHKHCTAVHDYFKLLLKVRINDVEALGIKYRVLRNEEFDQYEFLGRKYLESLNVIKFLEDLEIEDYIGYYKKLMKSLKANIIEALNQSMQDLPNKIVELEKDKKDFIRDNIKIVRDAKKNTRRRNRHFERGFNNLNAIHSYYQDYIQIENDYSTYRKDLAKLNIHLKTKKSALKLIPIYLKKIIKIA